MGGFCRVFSAENLVAYLVTLIVACWMLYLARQSSMEVEPSSSYVQSRPRVTTTTPAVDRTRSEGSDSHRTDCLARYSIPAGYNESHPSTRQVLLAEKTRQQPPIAVLGFVLPNQVPLPRSQISVPSNKG